MGRQSLQELSGQGVSGELRGQGLPLGLSLCAPWDAGWGPGVALLHPVLDIRQHHRHVSHAALSAAPLLGLGCPEALPDFAQQSILVAVGSIGLLGHQAKEPPLGSSKHTSRDQNTSYLCCRCFNTLTTCRSFLARAGT